MEDIKNITQSDEPYKLYYNNPYLSKFEAVVVSCTPNGEKYEVLLDRTAFYPEGGGQPADTGRINGVDVVDVTDVYEHGEQIIHVTTKELKVGEYVDCEVDWQRRFGYMQHHSGEHIISGLAKELYGLDNVGFHMKKTLAQAADMATNNNLELTTIDLNGPLTEKELFELESAANQAIYSNLPIEPIFPNPNELAELTCRSKKALTELKGKIRIVHVPGYDTCACCGLHVAKTGEIGMIKLIASQSYKGGVRISMLCGRAALEDYHRKNKNIYEISAMLSAKPMETVSAVEALGSENIRLKRQIWELKDHIFGITANLICPCDKVCVFESKLDPGELKRFHGILIGRGVKCAAIFSGDDINGYKYSIGGDDIDSRQLSNELTSILSGRGGGSKLLAQGTVASTRDKIEAFFNERNWKVFSNYTALYRR